jgi:hypothetical protein
MSDQHLAPGENYLQYRQRVLDTKSDTFCGAKWYYATIWLNSGMTTSCHHPLPHWVSEEEVIANPKALSNTARKKQERLEMQQGKRCHGCDYCWRVEDLGPDQISDRVYKSVLYSDDDLNRAMSSDYQEDVDLKYLEISFDRVCNLACTYCNPAFSTTWAKDIKQNGPYIAIGKDGQNHYGHAHNQAGKYDNIESNPYVEAFFKWWESDLHRTLTHLRLTGGEPLMSSHTWKLLDWFKEHKTRSDIYFAINTNLITKSSIIDRLIESTRHLENFHIYTSCEAMGDMANYVRDGFEWEIWTANIDKLLTSSSLKSLHSMCTISAITVPTLTTYLDWCMDVKKRYGKDRFYFTLNILRFPNFQSPLILPMEIRKQAGTELNTWLQTVDKNLLNDMEVQHVSRLSHYLLDEKNLLDSDITELTQNFKNFHKQYDQRRNKDFSVTFPHLKEWYTEL